MLDDKVVHVSITRGEKTKRYFVIMRNKDNKIVGALDLGEDEENVKKVVQLLKEEFGGIEMPPGWRN